MKKRLRPLLQFPIMLATALLLLTATPSTAAADADNWWCFFWCDSNSRGYEDTSHNDGGNSVPEIDPSTAVLAIGLVVGGLTILRDRRRAR